VIFLTASRGGLIAFIFLVLAIILWERAHRRLLFILGILLALGIALLILPDLMEPVIHRFQADSNIIGARSTIWETALGLTQEQTLVGYGAGNATYLVGEALRPGGGIGRSVHNPLLQIWVEN